MSTVANYYKEPLISPKQILVGGLTVLAIGGIVALFASGEIGLGTMATILLLDVISKGAAIGVVATGATLSIIAPIAILGICLIASLIVIYLLNRE